MLINKHIKKPRYPKSEFSEYLDVMIIMYSAIWKYYVDKEI